MVTKPMYLADTTVLENELSMRQGPHPASLQNAFLCFPIKHLLIILRVCALTVIRHHLFSML